MIFNNKCFLQQQVFGIFYLKKIRYALRYILKNFPIRCFGGYNSLQLQPPLVRCLPETVQSN